MPKAEQTKGCHDPPQLWFSTWGMVVNKRVSAPRQKDTMWPKKLPRGGLYGVVVYAQTDWCHGWHGSPLIVQSTQAGGRSLYTTYGPLFTVFFSKEIWGLLLQTTTTFRIPLFNHQFLFKRTCRFTKEPKKSVKGGPITTHRKQLFSFF